MAEWLKTKERNGWLVTFRSGLPKDFVVRCCLDYKGSETLFSPVRSSRFTRVFRFSWDDHEYYLKEYLFQNWRKHFRGLRRGNHLANIAQRLNNAGFHAPQVVCYARRKSRVFVVSESANAVCSVRDIYDDPAGWEVEDIHGFRRAFGREVGRLHQAGFSHGDMRWGNILVRLANKRLVEFVYIDNDRTRKFRRIPFRRRVINLVQVRLETIDHGNPSDEWLDFWEGYRQTAGLGERRLTALHEFLVCKTNKRLGVG